MSTPPPDFGGYDWVLRTNGVLTSAERWSLLPLVLRSYGELLAGRLRLLTGWPPPARLDLTLDGLTIPDTAWAKEASEVCGQLDPELRNHSYRTWLFASLLAEVDGVKPDRELLFVASMLHDAGLGLALEGVDFTRRGGDEALRTACGCGLPEARGREAADAVCLHLQPGVDRSTHGGLVQMGAMVDLVGQRLWDLPRGVVEQVVAAHPRPNLRQKVSACWRAEAAATPGGRAHFLERYAFFSMAIAFSPKMKGE